MQNSNLNFIGRNLLNKNKSFQLSPFTSDEDNDDLLYSQSTSTFYKSQEKISNQIICLKKLSTPSIITLKKNFTLSTQNELIMSHPPKLISSLVGLQGYSHDWKSIRTNENNSNLLDHTNVQSESTSNFNDQNESKILVKNYLMINVDKFIIDHVQSNNVDVIIKTN
ncbi:unnamed protein product [Rotaria magnacalcarata]|uniref:Uncharacterized protein n=1 Tax=Rotaria magnacalcarata TaxID=392030 RepID=A0A816S7X7_9BILA|nr:unnamed protein product [Rotaria magnacalcarata]CAF2102051.1 unnamed protein product [Rotaria magnacalcarata]CAF4215415.1 unnamed protein product [Rotaria magnacalcarata]CAF4411256.1 unnamed protein product [Rotaria magnacalcarata]